MDWLKTIWSEFIGLFVDDTAFAIAILAWVLLTTLGLPHLNLPTPIPAIILTIGLIAILIESATRRARRG